MSSKDIVNISDDDDDDITLLCYHNNKKNNVISVEQYSEDRDLHHAIMASLSSPTPNRSKRRFIDLTHQYPIDDDDVQVVTSWTSNRTTRKKPFTIAETGESSNPKPPSEKFHTQTFICEICVEPKSHNESFSIKGCTHSYCSDCVVKYVASKLQDNITQIRCPVPGCGGFLEPEHCRTILPPEVFDRWGSALCEAVIPGSEKFYCPYKDCSALLIDEPENGQVITRTKCPNCKRWFCAQCKVAWHARMECADIQKLNKDERDKEDIMLIKLAKKKKWMRCPNCKFYVAKIRGCFNIRCRCGHNFCYRCGQHSSHYGHRCTPTSSFTSIFPSVNLPNQHLTQDFWSNIFSSVNLPNQPLTQDSWSNIFPSVNLPNQPLTQDFWSNIFSSVNLPNQPFQVSSAHHTGPTASSTFSRKREI